jgi:hypothetical protein
MPKPAEHVWAKQTENDDQNRKKLPILYSKKSLTAEAAKLLILKSINGRDGGIRTRDPLHPMQHG